MNHLVYLDPDTSDLEKILSGVKTMVLKEINPAQAVPYKLALGDCLFFLRDVKDSFLRVKANVSKSFRFTNGLDGDLPHFIKEMQLKLQLTENQFNLWSIKEQVLLVEFENAAKINVIQIAPYEARDQSDWIAFEDFHFFEQKQKVNKNH